MVKEKEWAKGLTQEQFNMEFPRRFPLADGIPNMKTWVETEFPVYHGIDPFNAEQMVTEDQAMADRVKLNEQKAVLFCRGCKKEFNDPKLKKAHKARHEKHCKEFLAARM